MSVNYYGYYRQEEPDSPNNDQKLAVYSGVDTRRDGAFHQLFQRLPYPKRSIKNIKVKTKSLGKIVKTLDNANGVFTNHDYSIGDFTVPLMPNKTTEIDIVARRTAAPWMYSVQFSVSFIEQQLNLAAPITELNGLQLHHVKM